jgi:transcription initiation factor TFIIE subunit alpha
MGDKEEIISGILYEMVGNEGIKIINSLSKPATDLTINDKTRIPITRIRTTLNILHKYNIVSYNSTRDEKKGWFKYTWELKPYNIEYSIRAYIMSKLMKLKREYQEISQVNFFKCENGCLRLSFTEAYEHNFRCGKCNGIFRPVDSLEESKQIKREIDDIKDMLELLTTPSTKLALHNVG